MAVPNIRNNIMTVADRFIYYMSNSFTVQPVPSPPDLQESWEGLEDIISYYMARGYTFT